MEVIEQLVWGIASKPKAEILRKEKLSNIFKKKNLFFLNLTLQIIRLPQGDWNCMPAH